MLILSRKAAECIHLGDDIILTIVAVGNDKVRIGVQAPPGVKILRTELEVDSAAPLMKIKIGKPEPAASVPLKLVKGSKLESFVKEMRRAA